MQKLDNKIVIAGAGLSGLTAACRLKEYGYTNVTLVEASDRPGGRLKTDIVDGFVLNRGFHMIFTEYPMAEEFLDLDELNLKMLSNSVLVLKKGKIKEYRIPFIKNSYVYRTLLSNFGNFSDRTKYIKKRIELGQIEDRDIFEKFEIKTSSLLRRKNFSSKVINDFFTPLFSCLFMEEDLTTSRRIFDFYLKMLIEGRMAIPAKGIEAIPAQLASKLNGYEFIFNTRVTGFEDNKVQLDNGKTLDADIFIIATEFNGLYKTLANAPEKNNHRSVTNLYFSAPQKPFSRPALCLNGNDPKLVNNVFVMTNLSRSYAPKGKELISVSINGYAKADDKTLENEVKEELMTQFGKQVEKWELIKIYRINYAIPNQDYVMNMRRHSEMRLTKNMYACGDHLMSGNINAAIKSGRNVADLIHNDFNKGYKAEIKKKYSDIFGSETE